MRKRIVIGLLTVVVIGVVAFFVSQPKKGSVEWHKREYVKAKDLLEGDTAIDAFSRLKGKMTGRWNSPFERMGPDEWEAVATRVNEHQTALIACGYLIEQTFMTSNAASLVSERVSRSRKQTISRENRKYAGIDCRWWEPHVVTVTGRVEDMPKWEEAIRKMDFP